jgi:hypothetical protein
MNYKELILLVGIATVIAVVYVRKKEKNDLPIFDEATNTIKMKGNTYSASGKLINCIIAPCFDNLPN